MKKNITGKNLRVVKRNKGKEYERDLEERL